MKKKYELDILYKLPSEFGGKGWPLKWLLRYTIKNAMYGHIKSNSCTGIMKTLEKIVNSRFCVCFFLYVSMQ